MFTIVVADLSSLTSFDLGERVYLCRLMFVLLFRFWFITKKLSFFKQTKLTLKIYLSSKVSHELSNSLNQSMNPHPFPFDDRLFASIFNSILMDQVQSKLFAIFCRDNTENNENPQNIAFKYYLNKQSGNEFTSLIISCINTLNNVVFEYYDAITLSTVQKI